MTKGDAWNDAEVRQVLSLFLRMDPSVIAVDHPLVVILARRMMRTADAIADRLTALADCVDGRPHSFLDHRIWMEFQADPASLLASEPAAMPGGFAAPATPFQRPEAEASSPPDVRKRIETIFFREMILAAYQNRCALTGMEEEKLLMASPILQGPKDQAHRLNPANGICLNALHDRAFARHLITFDPEWRMQIHPDVSPETRRHLRVGTALRLRMPIRFTPDPGLMSEHRRRFEQSPNLGKLTTA